MTAESDPVEVAEESPGSSGGGRVDGDLGTLISSASGPANTGSGDQHNYFALAELPKRMRQQPLGEEARRLEPRFVEPPGWDRATKVLAAHGIVLLHGQPGSGIRSAALRLLSVCGGESFGPIRELLPSESLMDSYADLLKPDDVVDGNRLLLDLLDHHERLPDFQREFPGFNEAARERNAYLVVVLPRNRFPTIEPELRQSMVPLERPDGVAVLSRHLYVDGIVYRAGRRHAEVEAWASGAPMRDIATLAWNVREAREREPSDVLDDWCSSTSGTTTQGFAADSATGLSRAVGWPGSTPRRGDRRCSGSPSSASAQGDPTI